MKTFFPTCLFEENNDFQISRDIWHLVFCLSRKFGVMLCMYVLFFIQLFFRFYNNSELINRQTKYIVSWIRSGIMLRVPLNIIATYDIAFFVLMHVFVLNCKTSMDSEFKWRWRWDLVVRARCTGGSVSINMCYLFLTLSILLKIENQKHVVQLRLLKESETLVLEQNIRLHQLYRHANNFSLINFRNITFAITGGITCSSKPSHTILI